MKTIFFNGNSSTAGAPREFLAPAFKKANFYKLKYFISKNDFWIGFGGTKIIF